MRRVAVIGSTGSIGTQALDVMALHPDRFKVTALAANSSCDALAAQAARFRPDIAVLVNPQGDFAPPETGVNWAFGGSARDSICAMENVDDVIISVVGMAGLSAVMSAIRHKKRILLANKETLMTAGRLVMGEAKLNGVSIVPIDSEHEAIMQCLHGRPLDTVSKLLLTASGGPFRGMSPDETKKARAKDALSHPTWQMGAKITVDSATMMNKSIEIAEACHLFGVNQNRIDVVVHPQSIVHSAVEFIDGSLIAQMSRPDMRIAILYALTGENRLFTGAERLSLFDMPQLTFERLDHDQFPTVAMVRKALDSGGNACCVINAANESAVSAFLRGEISVGGIFAAINAALDALFDPSEPDIEGIYSCDQMTRRFTDGYIKCRLAGEVS